MAQLDDILSMLLSVSMMSDRLIERFSRVKQGGCIGANQLGILDPTFCLGEMGVIKGLDIAAYDAMGWNLDFDLLQSPAYQFSTADAFHAYVAAGNAVPEPANWALMIAGFGLIGFATRRARKVNVSFA